MEHVSITDLATREVHRGILPTNIAVGKGVDIMLTSVPGHMLRLAKITGWVVGSGKLFFLIDASGARFKIRSIPDTINE